MAHVPVTARMKVFLSHSSADKDLARRLAHDLQSANVDVWLDQWEVRVGEEFVQRIEHGLDQVEFVIVLLTRASVASEWVDREWRHKVQHEAQTKRIAVVPVIAEPCEIPDFLAQRSGADISSGSYPLGFGHLLTILRNHSNEVSIKAPERAIDRRERSEIMLPVVTPIALEVGGDLIPIFEPDGEGGSRAMNELARIRNALGAEFGFPFPGIRVLGNETDMPPRCAVIMIDEAPEVMFELGRNDVLVDETVEGLARLRIQGEPRDNPVTGQACARIAACDRAAAEAAGLATWDAAEYLFLALHAVLRRMASSFLDPDVTRRLVDFVESTAPELVAKTIPKVVSWFALTDILRQLVNEAIGIGEIGCILEALSKCERDLSNTSSLAEQVRHALSGQITAKFTRGRDELPVLLLDSEIESLISSAIRRTASGTYLAAKPRLLEELMFAVRDQIGPLGARAASVPILVTSAEVRPHLQRLVSLEFPSVHVLSPRDLAPSTRTQIVGMIRCDGASPHAPSTGQGTSTCRV
jgi:type III secretory pathway component EscV